MTKRVKMELIVDVDEKIWDIDSLIIYDNMPVFYKVGMDIASQRITLIR